MDEALDDDADLLAEEEAAAAVLAAAYGCEDEGTAGDEGGEEEEDDELAALEAAALANMLGGVPEEETVIVEEETVPQPKPKSTPSPAVVAKGKGGQTGKGSTLRPTVYKMPAPPAPAPAKVPMPPKGPPPGKGKGNAVGRGTGKDAGKGKSQTAPLPADDGENAGPATEGATVSKVVKTVIALNRAGHWVKGSGIDGRAANTLKDLAEERALAILAELEAKAATVKNPSAFIQLAARQPGGPDASKGVKRPAPADPSAEPPAAKRAGVSAGSSSSAAKSAPGGTNTVKVTATLAALITKVREKGIRLSSAAIKGLAAAEAKDAQIVLGVLIKGKQVDDPSQWILARLKEKAQAPAEAPQAKGPLAKAPAGPAAKGPVAKTPAAKAPVAKTPIAKTPVAKTPVAKTPVAKTPVAKTPVAKTPVAKTPAAKAPEAKTVAKSIVAKSPASKAPARPAQPKAPGRGKPPQVRKDLEFEEFAVQGKLQALNQSEIWQGPHPLDEATLEALLGLKDPQRALEILDEVEAEGASVADPSQHVLDAVAAELKMRW